MASKYSRQAPGEILTAKQHSGGRQKRCRRVKRNK